MLGNEVRVVELGKWDISVSAESNVFSFPSPCLGTHKMNYSPISTPAKLELKNKINAPGGDMEKIIAACGIVCSECPAYIATLNDDQEMRKKTAEDWSKAFGVTLNPEDICCDGCMEEGETYFAHCFECEIRKCVQEKGILNCAHCEDYACEKVEGLFKTAPQAKEELDAIRKTL